MLLGSLALADAALFTGAAAYVSFVEQPARLKLDDAALLTEWRPAYARGTAMQAPLAALGLVLGVAAWWFEGGGFWLVGALLMGANWPWTLLAVGPVNKRLIAIEQPGAESRALIRQWGLRHAVRTALGAAAVIACLVALQ
jgi:hypothetical protein